MLKYNDKSVDLKSDVDDLIVPDNVQAVIASRLAGLTTSQQSILQTASVIGRTFTLGMLTNVHPASEMLQNLAGDLKETNQGAGQGGRGRARHQEPCELRARPRAPAAPRP